MKIDIFDQLMPKDDTQCQEAQRVQFIVEALNSLNTIQATYSIYGEHVLPDYITTHIFEQGLTALPITAVNDVIVKQGEYPSDTDITNYTGISFSIMSEDEFNDHQHDGGCSCGHCH